MIMSSVCDEGIPGLPLPVSHTSSLESTAIPWFVLTHSNPWPSPPQAVTYFPSLSNSTTGGAARLVRFSGTEAGRWRIQTLSCLSTVTDETMPTTQLLGSFGHAGSTSNTGIPAEVVGR